MFLFTEAPVFLLLIFVSSLEGRHRINHCQQKPCPPNANEPWSYDESSGNGPSTWGNLDNSQCDGQSQSPINIDTHHVVKDKSLILQMQGYEECIQTATIENNGHTVQVTPTDNIQRSIKTELGEYRLTQFHFHWGGEKSCGSEHLINGKAKAAEMHLVHSNDQGQIAVIGVFLCENRRNNPEFNPLVNQLPSVQHKDENTSLTESLCLSKLLPKHKGFYRYSGSLTTPPCSEDVMWTVFKDCTYIGHEQLKKFRSLYSTTHDEAEQCPLKNNYRPVQELNGRPVRSSA